MSTLFSLKPGGRHGVPASESRDPIGFLVAGLNRLAQSDLLDRVKLKDDKINRSITLPAYVPDVATVQFWCAFVEVVLGEASFTKPIALRAAR